MYRYFSIRVSAQLIVTHITHVSLGADRCIKKRGCSNFPHALYVPTYVHNLLSQLFTTLYHNWRSRDLVLRLLPVACVDLIIFLHRPIYRELLLPFCISYAHLKLLPFTTTQNVQSDCDIGWFRYNGYGHYTSIVQPDGDYGASSKTSSVLGNIKQY